jgi:hypothetical protein
VNLLGRAQVLAYDEGKIARRYRGHADLEQFRLEAEAEQGRVAAVGSADDADASGSPMPLASSQRVPSTTSRCTLPSPPKSPALDST